MKHRIATFAITLLVVSCGLVCARGGGPAAEAAAAPEPQRRSQGGRRRRAPARARAPRVDYTRFSHATAQHRQKGCDSCHAIPTANWRQAREGDEAFPDVTDYPGHSSCLDCHKRQFFTGARPAICSVCHTVVSPRGEARHAFRNPAEAFARSPRRGARADSDFVINFPHDRHQDVMARSLLDERGNGFAFVRAAFRRQSAAKDVDSCTICHKTYQPQGDSAEEYAAPAPKDLAKNELSIEAFWMKKGMMKTTPSGHASCFNCHWQDGGERPLSNDCAACHKPRAPGLSAATATAAGSPAKTAPTTDADLSHPSVKAITDADVLSDWSRRRVARFKHEVSNHQGVGCTACHVTITSQSRLGPDTLDVPIQTCSTSSCHGGTSPSKKGIILREVERRRKPDGAGYECAKCHVNFGKAPTPKSHADLFPAK